MSPFIKTEPELDGMDPTVHSTIYTCMSGLGVHTNQTYTVASAPFHHAEDIFGTVRAVHRISRCDILGLLHNNDLYITSN